MSARAFGLLVIYTLTGAARAEPPPAENLLPATTQVYVRWDGVNAHRDNYRQVTIGRLIEGDLAPLMKSLLDAFPKSLQSEYVDQKLLDGSSPDRLAKLQIDVNRASHLPQVLAQHGLIVAAEVGPM